MKAIKSRLKRQKPILRWRRESTKLQCKAVKMIIIQKNEKAIKMCDENHTSATKQNNNGNTLNKKQLKKEFRIRTKKCRLL